MGILRVYSVIAPAAALLLGAHEGHTKVRSNTQLRLPNNIYLADYDGDSLAEVVQAAGNRLFIRRPDGTGLTHFYFDETFSRLVIGNFTGEPGPAAPKDVICSTHGDNRLRCHVSEDGVSFRTLFTQTNFIGARDEAIVGDYNADGVDDILVYTPRTGVFRMYTYSRALTRDPRRPVVMRFVPVPNFKPGNLGTSLLNQQVRAGVIGAPGRDSLIIYDPPSGFVRRYDSVNDGGTLTFWWAFTAAVPMDAAQPDQLMIANADASEIESLVFRNTVSGNYRFYRPIFEAGTLQPVGGVTQGQLPVVTNAQGAVAFSKIAHKPAGEPGGLIRDDALFLDASTGALHRTDARYDANARSAKYTYWWAFTRAIPSLHLGWKPIKKDKWVVLKCALKDVVPDPKFPEGSPRYPDGLPKEGFTGGFPEWVDPLIQNDVFVKNLVTRRGRGMKGIFDYYIDNTYGSIGFNNVDIKGWYQTDVDSKTAKRDDAIKACKKAASDAGLDLTAYQGYMALWNHIYDGGAWGTYHIDMDSLSYDISFMAHELGHAYGLHHAKANYASTMCLAEGWANGNVEYCDPFDPMGTGQIFSANFSTFHLPENNPGIPAKFLPKEIKDHPAFGALNLTRLGVIPESRVLKLTPSSAGAQSVTVTLAPLHRPEIDGYLAVRIPRCERGGSCPISNDEYIVDFRQKSGWDVQLPEEAVMVRQLQGEQSFLVQKRGYDVDVEPRKPLPSPPWRVGYYLADEIAMLSGWQKVKVDRINQGPTDTPLPTSSATITITY